MKLSRSVVLDASADRVWSHVLQTSLLRHVSFPLQIFVPISPAAWPAKWSSGDYVVALWTFGVIPFGRHTIAIRFPDGDGAGPPYRLLDDGHGGMIRRWRHLITVTPIEEDRCVYCDEVEVAAGLLTPIVYLFACVFYWHRQRRWQGLVKSGFRYSAPSGE
jgi:hypothetical protein